MWRVIPFFSETNWKLPTTDGPSVFETKAKAGTKLIRTIREIATLLMMAISLPMNLELDVAIDTFSHTNLTTHIFSVERSFETARQ